MESAFWSQALLTGAQCKESRVQGNGLLWISRYLARYSEGGSGQLKNQHHYARLFLTEKSMCTAKYLGFIKLGTFAFLYYCISHLVMPECIYLIYTMDRKYCNRLIVCRIIMPFIWNANWKQVQFFLFCMKKTDILKEVFQRMRIKNYYFCLISYFPSTCGLGIIANGS